MNGGRLRAADARRDCAPAALIGRFWAALNFSVSRRVGYVMTIDRIELIRRRPDTRLLPACPCNQSTCGTHDGKCRWHCCVNSRTHRLGRELASPTSYALVKA